MNRIGFIGAGNMASSIIGGLINAGFSADGIRVSDPSPMEQIRQLDIEVMPDNQSLARWADIIVLAVKPQALQPVCTQISEQVSQHHLIVSIAAGIRSTSITNWLAADVACVRVMPNTPALLGLGMSGLYATPQTSEEQVKQATNIMGTTGRVVRFNNEAMIDAVTAVSGSGPAYYFLLMEAMIKAAVQQGLSEGDARLLVTQTALGAATMAQQSDVEVDELRRRVTSPGGTTEQAIKTLLDGNFMQLVNDAIDAAARRSIELSDEMDRNT